MQVFSLYDLTTGIVTSVKSMLNEAEMTATLFAIGDQNRSYVDGRYTPDQTYIKDGVAYDLPEKPQPWLTWNLATEAWEDMRTEAEKGAALNMDRAKASLSRRELCLELKRRGILTESDAILASRGEWPTALQPFLEQLEANDANASGEVLIEWAGASQINRTDTNIMVMASVLGVSIEEVDEIFGVSA